MEVVFFEEAMHDLEYYINIDVSLFLALHILIVFAEFQDKSRLLYLSVELLVLIIEESEVYIRFFARELVTQIDTESCEPYLLYCGIGTEVDIVLIDQCDIVFLFHVLYCRYFHLFVNKNLS
jgi:hypothetical protein